MHDLGWTQCREDTLIKTFTLTRKRDFWGEDALFIYYSGKMIETLKLSVLKK